MATAVHADIEQLAFLLGTWRGEGEGVWPECDDFRFREELVFEDGWARPSALFAVEAKTS